MTNCDWADLPENVLSSILSNLFAKDRHSFSLACRSWNQASKHSPFQHSPCLMNYNVTSREWNLFQYNTSASISLPDHINRANIRCVKYGWMLLMSSSKDLFFFDPFNDETICLPKPPSDYATVCFFHPPTSQNCFIVGISACPKDVTIGVLKKKKNKWRRRVYDNETNFRLTDCTQVLHQGLLYCLDRRGGIATFNIDKCGSWNVTHKCKFPRKLCGNILYHFLVRFKDTLLAIVIWHEERTVKVFRVVCEPNVKWEPVEDLGDKVLFLSQTASFAATAPWESMANRIYFTMMHNGDYVYYSLKDQKYHSCNSDYANKKSYDCQELIYATWIVAAPSPDSEIPRKLIWC